MLLDGTVAGRRSLLLSFDNGSNCENGFVFESPAFVGEEVVAITLAFEFGFAFAFTSDGRTLFILAIIGAVLGRVGVVVLESEGDGACIWTHSIFLILALYGCDIEKGLGEEGIDPVDVARGDCECNG